MGRANPRYFQWVIPLTSSPVDSNNIYYAPDMVLLEWVFCLFYIASTTTRRLVSLWVNWSVLLLMFRSSLVEKRDAQYSIASWPTGHVPERETSLAASRTTRGRFRS
eukprot:scaffold6818_cov95-Cylindrotheca_fusiformis.AAC.4